MARKKTDELPEPKKEDSKSSRQVNDVAKPGETAADPTSRPIITRRGDMIKQDPMVSGKNETDESEGGGEEKQTGAISKSNIKVEPTDKNNDKPADSESTAKEPTADEDSKTKKQDDKPGDEEPKDTTENKEEDKSASDDDQKTDSATIDSIASSAGGKKGSAKEKEEEQKKNEKVRELIAGKQYNVAITEGGHKASSERFVSWLLLFLLVASIGVYLAIDAGYVDVGIALPYEFIGN